MERVLLHEASSQSLLKEKSCLYHVETPPIEENEKHSKRELCTLSDSPDNAAQSKHRDQTVRLTANGRSILNLANFQTARVIPAARKTYSIPLHRQLAAIPSSKQKELIHSLNLCRESDRVKTFTADWPSHSAPSAKDMAASGWFYLGNLDRTQCFSCGGVLRNWRRLDNPNTEHNTHFPHCAMAQGQESQDIPVTVKQEICHLSEQQKSNLRLMFPCESPVTPMMMSTQARSKTFNNHWPFTRATTQMLVEAGFFSLGVRDRVKCFYCNGGLQNWKKDDDPWEEHAKWYPSCEFLLQQKGPEYVHAIVARFPNIKRPILRAPGQDIPPRWTHQSKSRQDKSVQRAPEATKTEKAGVEKRKSLPIQHAIQENIAAANREDEKETEMFDTVVGMGFDEHLVKEVMSKKRQTSGFGYESTVALLEAVQTEPRLNEEETERKNVLNSTAQDPSQQVSYTGENMQVREQLSANEVNSNLMNLEEPVANTRQITETLFARGTSPSFSSFTDSRRNDLNQRLKKQLVDLEDERRCKICLDKTGDVVFIPCGHICCCAECTSALRACPVCRQNIVQALRTYRS